MAATSEHLQAIRGALSAELAAIRSIAERFLNLDSAVSSQLHDALAGVEQAVDSITSQDIQ